MLQQVIVSWDRRGVRRLLIVSVPRRKSMKPADFKKIKYILSQYIFTPQSKCEVFHYVISRGYKQKKSHILSPQSIG